MDTDKLKDNALPLQSRVFEIQNQPDAQFRNSKVIKHLATFAIGNSVNHLCLHNNCPKRDEIGDEFANFHLSKKDGESALLIKSNGILLKEDNQGVLVNLFVKAMAKLIEDIKSETDDSLRFNL